jgi:DNA primase
MDAIEEIKSRLSIEDVVGDYVELKRAGRNFRGLSPFSAEKTPSFMVSPEKQIWHDFSSGKGGNMFSFVMEMEGLEFKGALELLARKAGVELADYRASGGDFQKKKDKILEALELATKYYQQSFVKSEDAINYVLKIRGYTKSTVADFRLGYAPNSGSALADFLKKRGISDEISQKAGLVIRGYRGSADMFRGRLMIPLSDQQGQTIGFTARILVGDEKAPKYINTPATIVYDKSRHIFGLNLAKDAIRQAGFVVIVEGNLDVIASHQAGVKNVAATAGTALTAQQLKILQRFTPDIRLCFDQDKAGINAAERSIAVAQGVGVQLSIVTIEGAKDPDELIKKDAQKWTEFISKPKYAIDWLIDKYTEQFDLKTALGKKQFTGIILNTVNKLEDEVERDHYIQKMADITEVSKEAIIQKSEAKGSLDDKPKRTIKSSFSSTDNLDKYKYEDQLLSLLVTYPITRRLMQTEAGNLFFHSPERQRVYEYLEQNPQATIAVDIPEDLKDVEDYVKIVTFKAEELYDKFDANERLRELRDLISKLTKNNQKEQREQLTEQIKLAEEQGDTEAAKKLLEKYNSIYKQ